MKRLPLFLLVVLLLTGCDDLFDKGDAEKVYSGPDVVEFFPLQRQINIGTTASTTVAVQLIGPQRSSDLTIDFQVAGTSTAVAGTHYNIATSSPVTIPAGSSSATIQINVVAGSLNPGQEVRLDLELLGGQGVEPAENLKTSRIFLRLPS